MTTWGAIPFDLLSVVRRLALSGSVRVPNFCPWAVFSRQEGS